MTTRIREFRKLRGMTLNYLAQRVGTTAQTIQRLETGNMTVSLDWLHKIAEVFGLPAAALLVTDKTESVAVLGDLDGTGELRAPHSATHPKTLSTVVAWPNPIAVRCAAVNGSFEADTVLIANKMEFDADVLLESRSCLVGFRQGRVVLRTVTSNTSAVTLVAADGAMENASVDSIEWVAPVIMAVRYLEPPL